MNRRQVLAATTNALAFAGCLGDQSETTQTVSPTTDSPTTQPPPEKTFGFCSAATTPMSRKLVDAGGDDEGFCYEGATTALAVENERDDSVALVLEVTSGEESVLTESYDLDPGERVVEGGTIDAHSDHEFRVSIDGEETTVGSWEGTSCFRHGVAVTSEGVVFGLVPPLSGPGDTMHDCYAGDDAHLSIYNGSAAHSVSVVVADHCADSTTEETFEIEPDDVEQATDLFVAGGRYDVTIDVAGGDSETYDFHEECWGLTASIDEDGGVTIQQIQIE